jgi:RNA polymerase sigma-70 factor (ECF subfamily)
LTQQLEELVASHWLRAVAVVTRVTRGDVGLAEDAVQEACLAALAQWPQEMPATPAAWLTSVATRKAVDRLRREAKRADRESLAGLEQAQEATMVGSPDDDLGLIFMCCHPALDPSLRIALTLRCVGGLSTAEIGSGLLSTESAIAKRLVRGRARIRQSGIRFRVPSERDVEERLPYVLKVIQLIFNEGHRSSTTETLVRTDLCDAAIGLARSLNALLPDQPEVAGLLALLLLTDARRAARTDAEGDLVRLEDQDRSLWDRAEIEEGEAILVSALRERRPGSYQIQAAIAACHAQAATVDSTDWRQIALLYGELARLEPNPVIEANRAVAVAMAEGPAAGLEILDKLLADGHLDRWYQFHVARADLLSRLGRVFEAREAYARSLEHGPSPVERRFIRKRLNHLQAVGA